ncbi:MAG: protein kinase, partial [Pseudomonadota bacterium]
MSTNFELQTSRLGKAALSRETEPLLPLADEVPLPSACPGIPGFKLVEKVHEGPMSVVWRAVDEARQTPVAMKLVPLPRAPSSDMQTLARLVRISAHPGLVTLINHGCQGLWWYQVADWIDGETLDSWQRTRALSVGDAPEFRIWMKQLAHALEALHRAGFVHGDVKPANVLVSTGQARFIDLVGLCIGASPNRRGLTLAFASPEARNGGPFDQRDDVFSFAAMILRLLAGDVAHPSGATGETVPLPKGLTSDQWRVLQGVLGSDRESRIASAPALVDAMWPATVELQTTPKQVAPSVVRLVPARPVQQLKIDHRNRKHRWGIAAAASLAALALTVETGRTDLPIPPYAVVQVPLPAVEVVNVPAPEFVEARAERVSARPHIPPPAVVEPVHAIARTPPAVIPQPRALPTPPEDAVSTSSETVVATSATPVVAPSAAQTISPVAERPRTGMSSLLPVRFSVPVRPERPNVPAIPERPEVPVVPERPDVPAVPERPEIPARPERPEVPALPDRPDKPERPEKP